VILNLKCGNLKCVQKPIRGRLSLTHLRWGGKRLHLLQCTDFYQNRPSFIWDITK